MDIKSIHKLDKNNVVPDPLSQKEEYQREMPSGTTQIFNAMQKQSWTQGKGGVCERPLCATLFCGIKQQKEGERYHLFRWVA